MDCLPTSNGTAGSEVEMNTPSVNPSGPDPGRPSGNLSYWYHLADLHGLRHFWSPFARAHRLGLTSDMENAYLHLDPMSTAPLLYDSMLVLYEILERWSLQALLVTSPQPTLRIAKTLPAPTLRTAAAPWATLRSGDDDAISFWRTLAASQTLDIGDMGPKTTRRLRLRPDTSALDLFNALVILQHLRAQGEIDYELSLISIDIIERLEYPAHWSLPQNLYHLE